MQSFNELFIEITQKRLPIDKLRCNGTSEAAKFEQKIDCWQERLLSHEHNNEWRDKRGEVPVCTKFVPNSYTVPSNGPLSAWFHLGHLQKDDAE